MGVRASPPCDRSTGFAFSAGAYSLAPCLRWARHARGGELRMLRSIIVAIRVVTAQLVATVQARAESPDCQGHWVWSYTLDRPQGSWSEDGHFYIVRGKIDGTVVF